MTQDVLSLLEPRTATFPETKYMGSKQRLLPFIRHHLKGLEFNSALDAFSGTSCVAYLLKQMGKMVYANDFLKFCFHVARSTIENNDERLTASDIEGLLRPNRRADTFIQDTYGGLFFKEKDCGFLDNLWVNISELRNPVKKSLALAAASRAAMKKRPRGLFTFTGRGGEDGRRDLRLSMKDQFVDAVTLFNESVFSNGLQNCALNDDVFSLPPDSSDLVYLDPPYVSRYSDCDYTRRYHFVEGYCTYWKDAELMMETKTKKIRSYATAFASRAGAPQAFRELFNHFAKPIIVLSYSSNCVPSRDELISMLSEVKQDVKVYEAPHRYHHGNQSHKVGDNNSEATEYLFIAR